MSPAASAVTGSAGNPIASVSAGAPVAEVAHLSFARENTLGVGLDPHKLGSIVVANLMWYFYESLYVAGVSNPTTFIPQLAAGDPTKVDDLTYTVKIRDGAKFHDGSSVTADDVVYSFERLVGLGSQSPIQRYTVNFASFTASAEDEVTFKLKKPTSLFVQRLSMVRIVSKAAVTGPNGAKVLGFAPVGSGPYKVTSADPNTGAELVKFDDYNGPFKGVLPAKAISMKVITDGNARLAAVQSSAVDATMNVSTDAIGALKSGGLSVAATSSYVSHIIFVNGFKDPFKDPRVLQAVMYAMDRDAMVQAAYNGYAEVADSFTSPSATDYSKPSTIHNRDIAKAKQLLSDAGFPNGVSFELQVPSNDPTYGAVGQLMQQQVKEAGITITLRPGDSAGLFARVKSLEFQAMYTQSSPATIGSADAEFIYRWSYYDGADLAGAPLWKGTQQQQIEDLLDQAATAATEADYKSAMSQVVNLVAEYGPAQPVVHPKEIYVWDKAVPDLTPSPVGEIIFAKGL